MVDLTLVYIRFSAEKNEGLRRRHGVGFEEIVDAMRAGAILDFYPHPSEKFRHQHVAVVRLRSYVYLVPFVPYEEGVFLKTFYPSRKATKYYGGSNGKK
jgi:uncharacterized DUF497 family protein